MLNGFVLTEFVFDSFHQRNQQLIRYHSAPVGANYRSPLLLILALCGCVWSCEAMSATQVAHMMLINKIVKSRLLLNRHVVSLSHSVISYIAPAGFSILTRLYSCSCKCWVCHHESSRGARSFHFFCSCLGLESVWVKLVAYLNRDVTVSFVVVSRFKFCVIMGALLGDEGWCAIGRRLLYFLELSWQREVWLEASLVRIRWTVLINWTKCHWRSNA